MAAIANITVKKLDGTTDVTFTAQVPSSGDKSPAMWRDEASSTLVGGRTSLTASTQTNKARTYRHLNSEFVMYMSYTDTATGLVHVLPDAIKVSLHAALPFALPANLWKEAGAQACNLFDTALFQTMFDSGNAPT